MSERANDAARAPSKTLSATQSEPTKPAADERVLAHVDKWMAVIREINHERTADA
jgi:hypothetical protein